MLPWSDASACCSTRSGAADAGAGIRLPPTWVTRPFPVAVARCVTVRPGAGVGAGAGGCSCPAHQPTPAATTVAATVANAIATANRVSSSFGSHPHDTVRAAHKHTQNVTAAATTVTVHRIGRDICPPWSPYVTLLFPARVPP
ncbi:hypothetical protein [Streptomyces sp. NRRL B-24572]|uniref:hypothetical protein n=1 Tax=Streptomyces sp. NRRL B-24572 TaxID=1962156 RepID=UPI00117E91FD|nr:hypothetical protein [Streptomyces sp. NRRL B-24572]